MSVADTEAVIAGYARSPFTPAKHGALARIRPDDLMAQVVRALIERSGARPEDIEDIIVGCAFPEGEQGFNIGRIVGFQFRAPVSRTADAKRSSFSRHVITITGRCDRVKTDGMRLSVLLTDTWRHDTPRLALPVGEVAIVINDNVACLTSSLWSDDALC